jgi:FHS family L-fucose permease-like MFS transporter
MKLEATKPTGKNSRALVLVISLFFLWALTANLLPSLIPHLKKACRLNDFQSGFVDSAYWIAYFLMAIPAANIMRRYSYKTAIIIGLLVAATGTFIFYPASEIREFGIFLFALFLVASGMTFLETAANPYMTVLGSAETSSQRLNFAQAFNGLGAFVATFFLSKLVLSGTEYTEAQQAAMSPAALETYLSTEAERLKLPYVAIGIVLVLVAALFYFTKMPNVQEEKGKFKIDLAVFRHKHFKNGVIAQFFYVGAQVCISSFFIRYCQSAAGLPEVEATKYLGYLLLPFMIGRYFGTFLMRTIAPNKLLALYSVCSVLLLIYSVFIGGKVGVYALMGVEFFMSIMFPTIFALGIKGLDTETKLGSSYMVMSIVGGAIIPLALAYVARHYNMQLAYAIPLVCFLFVFYFGWRGYKPRYAVATN